MRFDVLGPLRANGEGGEVALARGRTSAALSWLLANAGESVSIDSLVTVLWGRPPATAVTKARTIVRELTSVLDPGTIEETPAGARIDAAAHEIDARIFESLARSGRARIAAGDHEEATAELARALELWRGEPYPDLRDAVPALAAINGLVDLRLSVQEDVNDLVLRGPVAYPLVGELRAQMTVHPERSRLRCQLALGLYRVDRQVEALEVLREARRELGQGDSRVVALEAAILRHAPELASGRLEW